MADPASKPPLSGVKVLDFTQTLPGPYATFLLASWGADVIKVESPGGDTARTLEPLFSLLNRGKRSVVLDLRDDAHRPALEALLSWADVLVEGFRPGVVGRLGCDYEAARARSPRLVYCSISAFGQEGPLRDHPGHDLDLQAISGVCHLERDEDGRPGRSLLPIADLSCALLAVSSICAALAARERTGEGAYLDVAMADGVLSWANTWGRGVDLAAGAGEQLGDNPFAAMLARPLTAFLDRAKLYAMPHYGLFEAADGRYLSIGIVGESHFWRRLVEELDLPRFAGLPLPVRVAAGPVLRPLIARRIRRLPRDEWCRRFREAGIPSSPVLTLDEATRAPGLRARGRFDERGWAAAPLPGAITLPPAPAKGEHTDEVLERLGVTRPLATDGA